MSDDRQQSKLRAPIDDRGVLIQPPLDRAARLLDLNRSILRDWTIDFGGVSAGELRRDARNHLLAQATRFTRDYRDVELSCEPSDETPVVLTGHQPELFHPGVWFKNFVLDRIAREQGAIPVHLIIDNDVSQTASLRVPAGTVREPILRMIELDRPAALPFEELEIQDRELYCSFDQRVLSAIHSLVPDPLLISAWQDSLRADIAETHLGLRLARLRHRLEAKTGLQTLEIPLSKLCDHETFRHVVANLLVRCDEVHHVYNQSLTSHRRQQRVRSEAHPVPNLTSREEWSEMPFWVWTRADPRRRSLFVRRRQRQVEITDHTSEGPWTLGNDESSIHYGLSKIRTAGVKIRPRALMTTLYARLFLSDLFLHGIGGAKYDELTDVLIERLFQVKPPDFLVATATLRLPIPHARIPTKRLSELKQRLHRLHYHPELFLTATALSEDKVSHWMTQKHQWIARDLPRGRRRERHERITDANRALRSSVKAEICQAQSELTRTVRGLRRQAILESREYAFCLFPGNFIQDALFDCLPSDA